MSNEVSEGLDAIPFYGVFTRLVKFAINPTIQTQPMDQNDLRYYIKDFLESLLLIGTITDLLCFLFPKIIKLDLGNIFSSIRFAFVLGLSELARVAIFYVVLLMVLVLATRKWHFNLVRQTLRSFAITNFGSSAESVGKK